MRLRQGLLRAQKFILSPMRCLRAVKPRPATTSAGHLQSRGFTLVELLAVLSIIGVLMALLLAGVQASREMARRTKCANNLRNQVLALENFCSAHQRYPAGRQISAAGDYSWCLESLPYLEQNTLFNRFDRTKPWSDKRGNQLLADTNLPIFRCPSAITKFDGKTDYAGILGTLLPGFVTVSENDNGVMVETGRGRPESVRPGEITDGSSHTILLAECCDRLADDGGRWVSGYNCISHNDGGINELKGSDIHSFHPNGALVAFADGRIEFVSNQTAEYIIGAICTRGGGEHIDQY